MKLISLFFLMVFGMINLVKASDSTAIRITENFNENWKFILEDNPNFKVFVEQMDYAQAQRPIDYGGLQIYRHIAEAIEKVYLSSVSPKDALNEAAEKSNLLLEQKQSKN